MYTNNFKDHNIYFVPVHTQLTVRKIKTRYKTIIHTHTQKKNHKYNNNIVTGNFANNIFNIILKYLC